MAPSVRQLTERPKGLQIQDLDVAEEGVKPRGSCAMRKKVRGANPSGWNFLKAMPLAGPHDAGVTPQGEAAARRVLHLGFDAARMRPLEGRPRPAGGGDIPAMGAKP